MTVSTSAALLDLLKESEILSSEQLTRAEDLIGEESDTRAAARRLVKAGLLTRWQASQLLRGSPLLSLGKYVLLDRLPWGSNHGVFLATHPMMDRKVALNVLDRTSSSRSDSRESFISDARAIAALDHRHLIHVFDIDEAEGRCFLVMEYVDGRNLHDIVRADGPMSIEAAADILRQAADGLAHAHQHKLIHGGFRPTNIILDEHGTAKIIDLGLSKFDDLSKKPEGEEDDSKILGIADYVSPEQATGQLPKATSDIYSLGCIAFLMLSGKAPYAGGSYTQRLQRHQHDKVPDVRKVRKDVPEDLAKIIAKMMAKEPADRYQSAEEVVDALDQWWAEYRETIAAQKPKPTPKAAPQRTSNRGKEQPSTATMPVSTPPPAAPPPPKKNGKPRGAKLADTPAAADLPKIEVGASQSPGKTQAAPQPTPKQKKAYPPPAKHATPGAATASGAETPPGKQRPKSEDLAPAAPQKDAAKSASSTAAPDAGEARKKRLPLALIIAAAGVVLLLFGIGVGVGVYFAVASLSDDGAQVAEGGSAAEHPGADDSAAGQTDDNETSEAPADEGADDDGETDDADASSNEEEEPQNEQGMPVPGDEGDQPDDEQGAAPGPDADAPEEEPDDGSGSEPQPDPGQDDEGSEQPAGPDSPKPGGGNKKPPKEEPKPPQQQDPFRALTDAVALPPVSGEGQPASLGKIHLADNLAVYIDLLLGDRVAPKERDVFTLARARNGLAERDWEVKLESEGEQPVVIANMSLKGDDLQFQWTPAAAEQEATPYLANCLLNLRTSEFEHFTALRQPKQVKALPFRLDAKALREKYELDTVPRKENLFFEITGVGGAENHEVAPKQKLILEETDTTFVKFGQGLDQRVAAKIDAVMQKDLQLSLTPFVKAGNQTVPFNQKQLKTAHATLVGAMQQVQALIDATKRLPKKQREKAKKQYESKLDMLEEQYNELEKLSTQLEEISKKNVYITFRVFCSDGVHDVNLITGDLPPEAPEVAVGPGE